MPKCTWGFTNETCTYTNARALRRLCRPGRADRAAAFCSGENFKAPNRQSAAPAFFDLAETPCRFGVFGLFAFAGLSYLAQRCRRYKPGAVSRFGMAAFYDAAIQHIRQHFPVCAVWAAVQYGFCQKLLAAGLFLAAARVCIEVIQIFVGRTCDINDVIFNTLGGLVGIALYYGFVCLYRCVRRKKRKA